MKEALALVLALCLLCGAALATSDASNTITADGADNGAITEVTYEVGDISEFTVTIPPSIELTTPEAQDDVVTGTLNIQLNARKINIPGFIIDIALKGTEHDFALTSEADSIGYAIQCMPSGGNPVTLKAGDLIFRWSYGSTEEVPALSIVSDVIPESASPGDYSDKLTFTVKVTDPRTTTNVDVDTGWEGEFNVGF